MRSCVLKPRWILVILAACLNLVAEANAADAPSPQLAFSFKPVHKDVEIDMPAQAEFAKCEVKVERTAAGHGWVVYGPHGQVVRRFVDTNGDNVVDQWRYFQHGLEVYRDIDSNYNNKVDQSRWLNSAGCRWGIDRNEDGTIDAWKTLSPEELSLVAVQAMVRRDENALKGVLITEEDIRALGIKGEFAKKILDATREPGKKIEAATSASKALGPKSKWFRFDGSMPGIIPADEQKANADLAVYEGAMAIIDTDGKGATAFLQLGELVRVGDVWKLTQVPQILEGESVQVTVGGVLMQPVSSTTVDNATTGITPEQQKLIEQLQELDRKSPSPTDPPAALAKYNGQRADILAKLVTASSNDEERQQWTRQLVDGLAAAVQTGNEAGGLDRLKAIEADVIKAEGADPNLIAYVRYRRLLADYTTRIQSATNEQAGEVQTWWLTELEGFVGKYPESDDAADALFQLASSQELSGKVAEGRKWYDRLVADYGDSPAGVRAAGAVRRLDLKGRRFELSGKSLAGGPLSERDFRGKVTLVLFWSTWCKPCSEDLPVIQAAYQQFRAQGFEVLGVNLDTTAEPVQSYLKQFRVTWPQIHEDGGLECPAAVHFGIISLPTMFLVDAKGEVVNNSIAAQDLKTVIPELLKK